MNGEFDLIDRIIATLGTAAGGDGVVVGPGDDGAVLALPPDHELVVSTDTLVADRHYPAGACADAIGTTTGFIVSALFGMAIVGGNIARGPETITVTVFGHVPAGGAITRSGARAEHTLYVTGTLGGAGLALADETLGECSLTLDRTSLLARYWMPEPRIAVGVGLRGIASAAIDISDGLSSDLGHLCHASGVDCDVDLARVPLCPGADPIVAVAAGDDYELAFAAPSDLHDAVQDVARRTGIDITPISTVRESTGAGVRWFQDGAAVDVPPGFLHF